MEEKNKEEESRQRGNAERIMVQIKEESGRESGKILADASREAEKIGKDGTEQADRMRGRMEAQLRQELEKMRERVFSGINLEKKRIVLEEKDAFIRQVLDEVRLTADRFRAEPGYEDFLRRAVAEGARVVGGSDLEVAFSPADEQRFLSPDFILSLESLVQQVTGRTVTFRYRKDDFRDPGVLVSSVDGRIQFDNRFSGRLARQMDAIYAELLKESF